MTSAPAVLSVAVRDALASSYEELRRSAVTGHGGGSGFALLVRSGMARWMEVCIDLLGRPVASPPQPRPVGEQHQVAPDLRVEIARVLAQMALSVHAPGATTC